MLFPETEIIEWYFFYGYDVAENNSDVDIINSNSNNSESNTET